MILIMCVFVKLFVSFITNNYSSCETRGKGWKLLCQFVIIVNIICIINVNKILSIHAFKNVQFVSPGSSLPPKSIAKEAMKNSTWQTLPNKSNNAEKVPIKSNEKPKTKIQIKVSDESHKVKGSPRNKIKSFLHKNLSFRTEEDKNSSQLKTKPENNRLDADPKKY